MLIAILLNFVGVLLIPLISILPSSSDVPLPSWMMTWVDMVSDGIGIVGLIIPMDVVGYAISFLLTMEGFFLSWRLGVFIWKRFRG